MMDNKFNDFIIRRRDGQKICKICQRVIEDVKEHMELRHSEYMKYFEKKEEKKNLYYCCYCGLWVKTWQKHMKEKHQDVIASVTRKKKPKPKEELKIW